MKRSIVPFSPDSIPGNARITNLLVLYFFLCTSALSGEVKAPSPTQPIQRRDSFIYSKSSKVAPTVFRLGGSRWTQLEQAAAGFDKTHILGVALGHGQVFMPAMFSDDVGLGFIIPPVAALLDLPLSRTFDLCWASLVVMSFISGATGILAVTSARDSRFVGIAAIALTLTFAARIGDVYLVMTALPIALVPWIVAVSRRASVTTFLLVAAVSGAAAAIANLVRSQCGSVLLIFLVCSWGLNGSVRRRIRWSGLLTAALCFVVVWRAEAVALAKRDAFLRSHTANGALLLTYGHPLWHGVYIGLAFVKNYEVPHYLDEVAIDKVQSIDHNAKYLSPEYERILMHEVMRLARTRPLLVLANLLAKMVVVAVAALIFGNVGWLALLSRPLNAAYDGAFALAIAASAIPCILVRPGLSYLTGVMAYCAIFAAVSYALATESEMLSAYGGTFPSTWFSTARGLFVTRNSVTDAKQ